MKGAKIFISNEEWRSIDGKYPYQVSSAGRVRSVDRRVNSKNGTRHCSGTILTMFRSRGGYPIVYLKLNNKLHVFDVHRFVAQAFICNPNNKKWVNHINGVKWDNRAMNLEWVTPSENRLHAIKIGIQDDRGEKSKNAKLTTQDVIFMRQLRKQGMKIVDIAQTYFPNLHKSYINLVINQKRWKHV